MHLCCRATGAASCIKIVQVIKSGTLGTSKAELIVNDPNMYQYVFRRIENFAPQAAPAAGASPVPKTAGELPAS